jgi:glycerophosphoryl diester phosphodiesterase
MTALPPEFLRVPLAHRALHDAASGRAENSLAAIEAACEAGYGIEIDVQRTADCRAVVFHDDDLLRLTGKGGSIHDVTAAEAGTISLRAGGGTIPTLAECLGAVRGRSPLLVEIKDQSGEMGPATGELERTVAADLEGYAGPVAVMSFNPHSVAAMKRLAPAIARGLVTCAWTREDAPTLGDEAREALAQMTMFGLTGSAFVSHDVHDLRSPELARLKAGGVPILTWTVRSQEQEHLARAVADNITFEGYLPAFPA